jgi:hypothetical protein
MKKLIKENKMLIVLIMLMLAIMTFALVVGAKTYVYVEVDVRLTERYEEYAVYTFGTERESFGDVEIDQTFTMDFYTSQGDTMDVLEYKGERDVITVDGKRYIRFSRLHSAFGRPLG